VCEITYDDRVMMTGFVDSIEVTYDATRHELSLAARAKTGDLIDCSAPSKGGTWAGATIVKIAKDLCAPYGIDVSLASDASAGKAFSRFAVQIGETVYEALERAARQRSLLLQTLPSGDLVIGVPYRRVSERLELGSNVMEARYAADDTQRFSSYRVTAQLTGNDQSFGSAVTTLARTSTDGNVSRYRPFVIMAEGEDSGKELEARATWEAKTRAAKARTYSATVAGWAHADGTLWAPGMLVKTIDPWAGLDAVLLVSSVELSLSASGWLTKLELSGRHAYDVEPLAVKPKGARGQSWN